MAASTGSGRFAVRKVLKESQERAIWLATDPYHSDQEGVVRLIRRDQHSLRNLSKIRGECAHLSQMRHPNIATGLDFGEIDTGPYLFSEYVTGGPVDARGSVTTQQQLAVFLTQVLRGLHYLHTNGVVHGDLTLQDILIQPKTNFSEFDAVRLIDYGLCEYKKGATSHLAPELFSGAGLSPTADFYSLGVTLYQCLKGALPFPTKKTDPSLLLKTKLDKKWHIEFCKNLALEGGFAKIASELMSYHPEARPSNAAEVLKMIAGLCGESLSLAAPTDFYDQIHRAKFTGRIAFCEESLAHLEQGRSVWIWGPRGRGKSRVLEELRWVVEMKGWPTCFISGSCNASSALSEGMDHNPLVVFWDNYPDASHPSIIPNSNILYCLSSNLPPVPTRGWAGLEIPAWAKHELETFLREATPQITLEQKAIDHMHRLARGHPGDIVVLLQVLYDKSHGLGLASPESFLRIDDVYAERRNQLVMIERDLLEWCLSAGEPQSEAALLRRCRRPAEEVRRALKHLVHEGFLVRHYHETRTLYTPAV